VVTHGKEYGNCFVAVAARMASVLPAITDDFCEERRIR
jgi:hypothetical protein